MSKSNKDTRVTCHNCCIFCVSHGHCDMMRCDLMCMNRLVESLRKFRVTSHSTNIWTWRRFAAALLGYDSFNTHCSLLERKLIYNFSSNYHIRLGAATMRVVSVRTGFLYKNWMPQFWTCVPCTCHYHR